MYFVGTIVVAIGVVALATTDTYGNEKNAVLSLANQLMMEQLAREEQVRTEGSSGIKQVRVSRLGTKSYFQASFGDDSVAGIHDHADQIRTVGMGEFVAVLNGVEFRTSRNNDYRLYQPSKTSKEYHAVDPIEFPDVPPEVLEKQTVEEEIDEMRLFFKAWKEQNETIRNYKPYFRPVLCYLEGAWTKPDNTTDPFELIQKIRFGAYSGREDPLENNAYLPTSLMGMINGTIPDIAQWNYRILCQPLKDDLPLNKLRVVDDLATRMKFNIPFDILHLRRSARFQLSPDKDPSTGWPSQEQFTRRTLLDDLMGQIPGMDNGPADIVDNAFDQPAMEAGKREVPQNSGRYHRWFETGQDDETGMSSRKRGFADDQLFMAMTSSPKMPSAMTCYWRIRNTIKERKCLHQSWTYAIPMEIIYLTPLSKWNPHNITFEGVSDDDTSYYLTPDTFYTGQERETRAADTSRSGGVYIKNMAGEAVRTHASGVRIMFPEIAGIDGIVRQRYPIMPIYGEGSSFWKKLNAFEDKFVKNGGEFVDAMLLKRPTTSETSDPDATFVMSPSTWGGVPVHTHEVTLTSRQMQALSRGNELTTRTTEANGHSHELVLKWAGPGLLRMVSCDAKVDCFDQHGHFLTPADGS